MLQRSSNMWRSFIKITELFRNIVKTPHSAYMVLWSAGIKTDTINSVWSTQNLNAIVLMTDVLLVNAMFIAVI